MTREEELEAALQECVDAFGGISAQADDGSAVRFVRWLRAIDTATKALAMPKDDFASRLSDAHGQGQESAIADVNAGRVDDMIRPRLLRVAEAVREACAETLVSKYGPIAADGMAGELRALDLAAIVEGVK